MQTRSAAWPNWIRRLTTDQEIRGSSPCVVTRSFLFFFCWLWHTTCNRHSIPSNVGKRPLLASFVGFVGVADAGRELICTRCVQLLLQGHSTRTNDVNSKTMGGVTDESLAMMQTPSTHRAAIAPTRLLFLGLFVFHFSCSVLLPFFLLFLG